MDHNYFLRARRPALGLFRALRGLFRGREVLLWGPYGDPVGGKQNLTNVWERSLISVNHVNGPGRGPFCGTLLRFCKLRLGGIQAYILDLLIENNHSPFSENSYSKNLKVKFSLPFC